MKILFIISDILQRKNQRFKLYRPMQPLGAAVIKRITPKEFEFLFIDDRLDKINYDLNVDVVAISVEAQTARRAYQIANEFRKRKKIIIFGGLHATLNPEDVKPYADSILIGEGEEIWPQMLEDLKNGCLKPIYKCTKRPCLDTILPDRSIFKNKKYLPIFPIETSRGCIFNCSYCTVGALYQKTCTMRPLLDVISEIKSVKKMFSAKYFFFVDDNLGADVERTKKLLTELIPLKIKWICQISIHALFDAELTSLMKKAGCIGVLIGFESLNKENLKIFKKQWNKGIEYYQKAIDICQKSDFLISGTFIFGNENDNIESFKEVYKFAQKNCFFYTGFYHLTPFPGTPVYRQLQTRLRYKKWWLESDGYLGEVVYNPLSMSHEDLRRICVRYRKRFFSFPACLSRAIRLKGCYRNKFKMLFGKIFKELVGV